MGQKSWKICRRLKWMVPHLKVASRRKFFGRIINQSQVLFLKKTWLFLNETYFYSLLYCISLSLYSCLTFPIFKFHTIVFWYQINTFNQWVFKVITYRFLRESKSQKTQTPCMFEYVSLLRFFSKTTQTCLLCTSWNSTIKTTRILECLSV